MLTYVMFLGDGAETADSCGAQQETRGEESEAKASCGESKRGAENHGQPYDTGIEGGIMIRV